MFRSKGFTIAFTLLSILILALLAIFIYLIFGKGSSALIEEYNAIAHNQQTETEPVQPPQTEPEPTETEPEFPSETTEEPTEPTINSAEDYTIRPLYVYQDHKYPVVGENIPERGVLTITRSGDNGEGLVFHKKAAFDHESAPGNQIIYSGTFNITDKVYKKATRVAAEGMAYADVIDGVGVIVEVNCESDFVAGGPLFAEFVSGVAKVIAKEAPADVDALMAAPWYTGAGTVADAKNELFLSVRENMNVRRFERIEGKCVPYVHMKGKVAVLVELDTAADGAAVTELGKDVAMQICALNPQYLDQSLVPADFIEKEKEIRIATAKQDPKNAKKPDAILEKIVMGGLSKMYKEICLLQMPFVKDDKVSVSQHVAAVAKEAGAPITVKGFVRYEKGEGIEKRQDDLAAEVAKMVKG